MTPNTNHSKFIKQLQQAFLNPKEDGARKIIELVYNQMLQDITAQYLNAPRYAQSSERKGYRNGQRVRKYKSTSGLINLVVPQVRNIEPVPIPFERYSRVDKMLLIACYDMYLSGVSTRRVTEFLKNALNVELSASMVTKVKMEFQAVVQDFLHREINEDIVYIIIDGTYINVKENGHVEKKCVYVVEGLTVEGRREILSFTTADPESTSTWADVFRSLIKRGLKTPKLVTSDAHRGIRGALNIVYENQYVPWQRCWVHFNRNITNQLSYKKRTEVCSDLKNLKNALVELNDEPLFNALYDEFVAKWGYNKGVLKTFKTGIEDCFVAYTVDKDLWRSLYTTNHLERIMREIKRSAKLIHIFPNIDSAMRIVAASAMRIHEKWFGNKLPRKWRSLD